VVTSVETVPTNCLDECPFAASKLVRARLGIFPMFAQLSSLPTRKQHKIVAASVLAHAALFLWILHPPEPRLLTASSVAPGHNGRVLTQIYFPTENADDSTTSSSNDASRVYRRQHLGHEKLTLTKEVRAKLRIAPRQIALSGKEDDSKTATLSKLGHGAAAGLPYGSLPGSPIYGDEIRPALPVRTSDPLVYPWQRPDSEGKVIIEIVIDERGEIVRKTVLQSLGPEIDNKCLAALDNWHFQPATQNGVPIPSKQDAIFPFKARGG
jgi:TonB family protein